MPEHTVKQGECLAKIAHHYGFAKPLDIWNHPRNGGLKRSRSGDANVLYPGDVLWVPEREQKHEERETGKSHPFKVKVLKKKLRIVIRDTKEQPVTGADWKLELGRDTLTGKTDGSGAVDAEIPVHAEKGKLTVGEHTWEIVVGHLNPVLHAEDDGLSGIQARLRNLGYLVEGAWGRLCEQTKAALTRFQQAHELPPTGKPDEPTKKKLEEAHRDEVKPRAPAGPPPAGASKFTVKVVEKLPETPPLCTRLVKRPKKKKPDPHPVAPTTTNVLAPPRKGRCGLCAKEENCLDNDYDFLLAVAQMASRLGGDAGAFLGIMHFETGHRYSASIQNPGATKATGLIQITKGTAPGLGTTVDELKAMCRMEQLGWVEKYFQGVKRQYPHADFNLVRDVVLAVFEPIGLDPAHAILGVSSDQCDGPFTEEVTKGKHTKTVTYWTASYQGSQVRVNKHQRAVYSQNAGLDRDGDGFLLRDDYPVIVNELLATCAQQVAEKGRELQKGLGAGAAEYQILRPGAEIKA